MTNNIIKKDGRVYILGSKNISDLYIGSTTLTIKQRKALHKSNHKLKKNKCRSAIVIDAGDWYMIEIEACPCTTKWELQQRERFHILNTPNAVNNNTPTNCKTQKEYHQQYKKQNADKIKQYNQQYNKQNADKIKSNHQQYYQKNVDKLNAQSRQYNKQNADKIKAQARIKDTCPNCGTTHRHDGKRKHQRTKTCTKIVDTEVNAVMKSMLDIICMD